MKVKVPRNFVCVMTFRSEFLFAKRYAFGCNFCLALIFLGKWEQGGEGKHFVPTIVAFSVSVLAVVTNKLKTAI